MINSLRFADDIDLTAELSEDLQQITDRMYVGIDLTAELSEDLQQITDRMYVGSKLQRECMSEDLQQITDRMYVRGSTANYRENVCRQQIWFKDPGLHFCR